MTARKASGGARGGARKGQGRERIDVLAQGASVVLDGHRYTLSGTEERGVVAVLVSDTEGEDRVTRVRASELAFDAGVGVWTLPGRLAARATPAGGQVVVEDRKGRRASPLRRV